MDDWQRRVSPICAAQATAAAVESTGTVVLSGAGAGLGLVAWLHWLGIDEERAIQLATSATRARRGLGSIDIEPWLTLSWRYKDDAKLYTIQWRRLREEVPDAD